ncbi:MAG: sporulation protein YqfD [Halanaerobiales bacterium]
MIKKIYRIWYGYIRIEIKGNALARFINQINELGIVIWDLERIRYDYYQGCIYIDDFNRLRSILRKRKCQVHILDKIGLPFFLKKVQKRIFLLIGLILFMGAFYVGSQFLWSVEIKGLQRLNEGEVLSVLLEQDIRRGLMKREVDIEFLEDVLIKELPVITWVNIKWRGTQLYIDLVEKRVITPPERGEIVAACDGVITELIVLKGQSAVNEGDTVVKGQTLIVPEIEGGESHGIVRANVWYEAVGENVSKKVTLLNTGRMKTYWGFKIASFESWLTKIDEPFQQYRRKRKLKKLYIWRNIALPIELIKEEHIEINVMKENNSNVLTLFRAKEEALAVLLKNLSDDSVIEDVISTVSKTDDNNKIQVRLLMKVEENIAYKEDSGGRS